MPSTRTHAPRGALVFDMRQLGRQAGSALTQTRTVPAPDDLRLELIEVPAGADIALEVRFEAVSEGVLATGTAIVPLAGECARCLAPLTSSVTVGFQELFLYAEGRHEKYDKHDEQGRRRALSLDATCSTWNPLSVTRVVLALPMVTAVPGGLSRAVRRVRRPARRRGVPVTGTMRRSTRGGRPCSSVRRAGRRRTSGPAHRRPSTYRRADMAVPNAEDVPQVTPDRDVRTGRPPRPRW